MNELINLLQNPDQINYIAIHKDYRVLWSDNLWEVWKVGRQRGKRLFESKDLMEAVRYAERLKK